MNDFSHPDAARQAAENPEFSESYREVSESLRSRRAAVADLELDGRASARLRQSMVRWVEDEVTEEFQSRRSWPRLKRRMRSLAGTWRELLGGSRAFRYASRGAMALGLGLMLGLGVDLAGLGAARASQEIQDRSEEVLPAPRRFGLDAPSSLEKEGEEIRRSRLRLPREKLEEPSEGRPQRGR